MRHIRQRLAIAGLLFVYSIAALAADPAEHFGVKDSSPPTGSSLRRNIVEGSLPFDKRYDELTPAQRELVKARYEPMAPDDEPPFPVDGLGPMMLALQKGAVRYEVRGRLDMSVLIGPDGAPQAVTAYETPGDDRFTKFAATILMVQKYKPAVCGGRPCQMAFPVQATFYDH